MVAARMLLPGVAPLTRAVELRTVLARAVELRPLAKRAITLGTVAVETILARTRKPRALVAAVIFARLVVTGFIRARLVEISGAITRRTGIAAGMIGRTRVALLPRLGIAAIRAAIRTAAEILARTPVGRAAGKFLVAAELSLRPISSGPIAVARRPRAVRTV